MLDATNTPIAFRRGTTRVCAPEETWRRLTPRLSSFGITRVGVVTGLDCVGIPTAQAVRPASRGLSVTQGKGADVLCAKVSAAMEAVEQYYAERLRLPLTLAAASELEQEALCTDVSRLPRGPRPLEARTPMLWVEGRRLSGERVFVPYEVVHLDFRLPLPPGSGCFLASSNGLASGNHRLEAVAHGLCEVIERDATALFYQAPAEAQLHRKLALESVDDPLCRHYLACFEAAGLVVEVWDTTSDLGVACMLCQVQEKGPNPFRDRGPARGAGCHPEPAVALSRALSEAAQTRLTFISGARDDSAARDVAARRAPPEGWLASPPGQRSFADVPARRFDDFEAELTWLHERLARAQIAVDVVDLSPEDAPVNVVRVVAAGLEGDAHAPFYRPGARALAAAGEA